MIALLIAALGMAAIGGAVALLLNGRGPRVQPNVFVNPAGAIDANNSPTVARNPVDPANVVVVNRIDRPLFSAGLHSSVDGGTTWETIPLPLPPGKDRPFAPDAAFGPGGTLFVSYVNLAGPGNAPENLWLARSRDGGRSLSEPVRIAAEGTFQARMAVGPDGILHVTWLEPSEVAPLAFPGPTRVVAVRSEDEGATWTEPVPVSDPDRERVGAASPVVDAEGRIFVLYQDFKDDVRDFSGDPDGPAWQGTFGLVLSRSDDGGRTFAPGVELESGIVPTERFLPFLPEFPSLAVDLTGTLYVIWASGHNGDRDVFMRHSVDGGLTWSEPVRVNDNPVGDGTDQYLPRVSVAASGRVDVVFYDRRRDPTNVMTDAFLAMSEDGGRSFENLRVSAASFDSRVGSTAAPFLPVDFGSRLGLDSTERGALAAWTDTRLGDEATGRQDIVASHVAISSGLASGPFLLGIATLLVIAALGSLLFFLRSRATRRSAAKVA